ncbi:hypothetical protein THAOC_31241, partial [Thalassiosira oceanica]
TARELLNLALTCKSFGGIPSGSDLDWSLAEEVAREAVSSGRNDTEGVRTTLPRRVGGETTWLAVLHESENPLKFYTLWGPGNGGIEHLDGSKTSVVGMQSGVACTAIASNYVMSSGSHYAQFLFAGSHPSTIGVVRPLNLSLELGRLADDVGFNFFDSDLFGDFLAAQTDLLGDLWDSSNVHSCEYDFQEGPMGLISWTD